MKTDIREVAVAFAKFLDEECIRNICGWSLCDETIGIEFQLDELFDYWIENHYKNQNINHE